MQPFATMRGLHFFGKAFNLKGFVLIGKEKVTKKFIRVSPSLGHI